MTNNRLFGNVIFLKSHKQHSATICGYTNSSSFSEYFAMSEAVSDVILVIDMLKDAFKLELKDPIKIYEDNSGALAIAKYDNFTKNSKYVEVQYYYVHENYMKKYYRSRFQK